MDHACMHACVLDGYFVILLPSSGGGALGESVLLAGIHSDGIGLTTRLRDIHLLHCTGRRGEEEKEEEEERKTKRRKGKR